MNSIQSRLIKEEILFEVNGYIAQLCCGPESKKIAYQLRYLSYSSVKMIKPNAEKMLFDHFDALPNSRTHLIWYDGRPVATVRSSIWSSKYDWELTESIVPFKEELERNIGLKNNILESSRYAIAPHFKGRQSLFAQLLLFRIQDLSSYFEDCDHIITSVRENHVPFYERMLGFKKISNVWRYDWVDVPFVLLSTQQSESREKVTQRGMPACTAEERERYSFLSSKMRANEGSR